MDTESLSKLVQELLQKGQFKIERVEVEKCGEGEYLVNVVTVSDLVSLIGHRGEALMALQHIVKNIIRNQGFLKEGEHVKIDIDSYRLKQEKNVLNLADRQAKQVLETGMQAVLPPMSSFFRRIVHLHIKEKYPKLISFSQGEGTFRSVTISSSEMTPVDEAPAELYTDLEV